MTFSTRVAVDPHHTGPALDDVLLQAARLWVAQHRPYYAAALFRCAIVVTDRVPRLAVDGSWRIYINPGYANRLAVTRLAAALVHEVNHLLRDHLGRARTAGVHTDGQRMLWNFAGDAEINDDLRDDGLNVDRDEWVFPTTLGRRDGHTAEQYYAWLPHDLLDADDFEGVDWQCGSGSGAQPGDAELSPDDDAAPAVNAIEARLLRQRTATAVLEHAMSHGEVPSDLVHWAQELLAPVIDWRRVLASAVRHAVAVVSGIDDYSYRRFARRQSAVTAVRLPGTIRRVPSVAVVVDTSGSMSDAQIAQALGEVQGILRSASVADDAVTVLTVDATVAAIVSVTDARQVRRMGRGGTDMRVGIDAALRLRRRPDVIVVLTDGLTPWPERAPRGVETVIALVETSWSGAIRSDPPEWARVVRIAIGDVGRRSVG